jgi:hypothetical protein
MWTVNKELKWIKNALGKEHLYDDSEIRRLKRRLRDLRALKYDMNKGNGFGNGDLPVIDMTQTSMQKQADEAIETIETIDRVEL